MSRGRLEWKLGVWTNPASKSELGAYFIESALINNSTKIIISIFIRVNRCIVSCILIFKKDWSRGFTAQRYIRTVVIYLPAITFFKHLIV